MNEIVILREWVLILILGIGVLAGAGIGVVAVLSVLKRSVEIVDGEG